MEGTVAAAECCYGGELYDPAAAGGQMGICSTYLALRGYGYLGSTTIAYGPADGNGSADLICQYFLRSILAGASTGRATLEARQKFIQSSAHVSPTDLKTAGQYLLLGDPSVQPVVVAAPHGFTPKAMNAAGWSPKAARLERRQGLFFRGRMLGETQSFAVARPGRTTAGVGKQLAALARRAGLKPSETITFEVRAPKAKPLAKTMSKAMKAKVPDTTRFHVVFGKKNQSRDKAARGVAMVARTSDGAVVHAEELYLKN